MLRINRSVGSFGILCLVGSLLTDHPAVTQAQERANTVARRPGYWPSWRGPHRDAISTETGLLEEWPETGPPLEWRATGLGEGIHPPCVADGRVYVQCQNDEQELVVALDERSGEHLWTSLLGLGVRQSRLMRWLSQRCPTIDGDRVYAVTALGELVCLRSQDGQQLWRKHYVKDFFGKSGVWGFCDYPLVDGDKLICVPGGTDSTIVGLDKFTGFPVWKCVVEEGSRGTYAALVSAIANGQKQYVVFLENGHVGIAADTGEVLWRYDRLASHLNAITPLVRGNSILCANGLRIPGLSLLNLTDEGVDEQYFRQHGRGGPAFTPFQDSLLRVEEHIYGNAQRSGLVCIQWLTGDVVWQMPDSNETRGRNNAAISYADGRLYFRRHDGVVQLVEVNATTYIERGVFKIPDHQHSIGATFPVIAGGRLLIRDNDSLFCYDVRSATAASTSTPQLVPLPRLIDRLGETFPKQVTATGKNRPPDAPYVPTPEDVVERMLHLADVKADDVLCDLGCGDGRFLTIAARNFHCRAVGYEIDPDLVNLARERAAKEGVSELVSVKHADIFRQDLSNATIVTVFLFPELLDRLRPQFAGLRTGSRIVSHHFEIPGIEPAKTVVFDSADDGDRHRLFVYTIPLESSKR